MQIWTHIVDYLLCRPIFPNNILVSTFALRRPRAIFTCALVLA